MAKRGPSISLKMILTSTLLIVLIVVGFGFLNVYNIRNVYDASTDEKVKIFTDGVKSKGENLTQSDAQNLKVLLGDNAFGELSITIKQQKSADPELKVFYIVDRNRRLAAHSDRVRYPIHTDEDNKGFLVEENVEKDPIEKDQSWEAIVKEWKRRASANETDALAEIDVTTEKEGHVLLFAYPVFQGAVVPTAKAAIDQPAPDPLLGYIVRGYSLDPITNFKIESQKQKEAASYKAALRTGAVGGLFVLIGTVLAIFQGLSISRPLKTLAWKADQIARGDLQARVDVTSTDEIGLLGENFNFMADQLVVLLQQTAEKAHMEKELEVARTIQDTLVPPNDPISTEFLNFAGYFQPASQCGGDWWTYHHLKDGKILLVIGDVTGHGVPSAMITATAKAACDVARTVHDDDVSVTTLLEIMNDAIFQSAKRKFVMTCFASILDPKKRTITYANAGHNFPYIYREVEGKKRGEFGSLMIRGNRLGDLKESKYEVKTQELLPGDTIIWYTDGIVECESERGEEYGEKKFRASVRKAAHLEPAELRDHVVREAMNFFGEMPRKDDITMVIGRII